MQHTSMTDAPQTKSPTPRTDKALAVSDPAASAAGALLGIAGSLGLLARFDVTADEAVALIGFVGMAIAAVRGWLESRRRRVNS